MDKIIESYHGHSLEDKHISDLNFEKVTFPTLTDEEAAMIISTRVRVARNLAGFPLGTAISKNERRVVEEKVLKALEKLDGELKTWVGNQYL